METNPEVKSAISELDPVTILSLQVVTLNFMVRALLDAHPDQALVRQVFDQLLGQYLASPAILGASPAQPVILRDLAKGIFAPPASP